MDRTLRYETRQDRTLTPRMQHAVRLLQLSSLDYERELGELAARNPFLELEPAGPRPDPITDAQDGGDRTRAPASADPLARADRTGDAADGRTEDLATADARPSWDDAGDGDGDRGASSADDPWRLSAATLAPGSPSPAQEPRISPAERLVAEDDLRAHLRAQARLLRISDRDQALLHALIESLDDDGYLRLSLDEAAALAGVDPPADPAETALALRWLQWLEPAGVGARDLAECLRLQLDRIPEPGRALAGAIVDGHLDKLARRDSAALARALARPVAEVDALCDAIRRLDPRPGQRVGGAATHYIVPDVVVEKRRGAWTVRLNADVVPRLALNHTVAELFRRHREGGGHREMAAHLQEARWTVRNVDQRFATILAVAQSILRRQYAFFEHGPLAMKPLTLADVAAEIGAHESTVSRVTNNKYMATPAGVIELKAFFSRPMALASGGTSSNVAIRELVREIIADEPPESPLSDTDIARRLARQGVTITRRTVTKYRTLLLLPAAEQRRRGRSRA